MRSQQRVAPSQLAYFWALAETILVGGAVEERPIERFVLAIREGTRMTDQLIAVLMISRDRIGLAELFCVDNLLVGKRLLSRRSISIASAFYGTIKPTPQQCYDVITYLNKGGAPNHRDFSLSTTAVIEKVDFDLIIKERKNVNTAMR